jgi:hypothetical protein
MALALLYHPVGDVARGGIEVDAYLCDGQYAEGEALAVVLGGKIKRCKNRNVCIPCVAQQL